MCDGDTELVYDTLLKILNTGESKLEVMVATNHAHFRVKFMIPANGKKIVPVRGQRLAT